MAVVGDFRRAAVAFKTALSLSPWSSNAVRGLANVQLKLDQNEAAIELLTNYLERAPRGNGARRLLATAYGNRKQYRSAVAQLTNIFVDLESSDSRNLVQRAQLSNDIGAYLLSDGDRKQAEQWLTKSISIDPAAGPLAYQNLARAYLQAGEPMKGIRILEECESRFPQDPTVTGLLVECLERLGLYDEAMSRLTSVITSGKATPELYSDLGWLLADARRDYAAALNVLREGYEKFHHDRSLVNNLAYAYLMQGDAKSARAVLGRCENDTSLDPVYTVYLTATWGLLHMVEGDLDAGRESYKRAEQLASELGHKELARTVVQKMYLELARAYMRLPDYGAAREQVRLGLRVRRARPVYEQDLQLLQARLRNLTTGGSAGTAQL